MSKMTDFYGREFQIGDKCVRYQGAKCPSGLEEVTVLGADDKGIKILNFMSKEVYTQGEKLVNITAIEREVREQQFLNSVKALDVKPNDTVVASMIPNQITFTETKRMYDALKVMFPDNPVSMVLGIDVSVEKYTES